MAQITLDQPIIQVYEIAQIFRDNRNNPNLKNIIIQYIRMKEWKLSLLSVKFLKAKNIELSTSMF